MSLDGLEMDDNGNMSIDGKALDAEQQAELRAQAHESGLSAPADEVIKTLVKVTARGRLQTSDGLKNPGEYASLPPDEIELLMGNDCVRPLTQSEEEDYAAS